MARLFFIGLWNECDDEGCFAWSPLKLKMRLLAADSACAEELLAELSSAGMIGRFEVDTAPIGAVRNFRKFQKPERPSPGMAKTDELQAFVALSTNTSPGSNKNFPGFGAGSPIDHRPHGEGSPKVRADGEGMVLGEEKDKKNKKDNAAPSADRRRPCASVEPYAFEAGVIRLNAEDLEAWRKDYPNLSLEAELRSLSEWAGRPENTKGWFHAVQGALAKRNRESALAVERVKAEATARAHAPPARQPSAYVP